MEGALGCPQPDCCASPQLMDLAENRQQGWEYADCRPRAGMCTSCTMLVATIHATIHLCCLTVMLLESDDTIL
jgi:hypothetical protein